MNFRSNEEVSLWCDVLKASTRGGSVVETAIDRADKALEAFRQRFSPDLALSAAEANAMGDFGYRFVLEAKVWVHRVMRDSGVMYEVFDAFTGEWCRARDQRHPGDARSDGRNRSERWDRKDSLRTFLAKTVSE